MKTFIKTLKILGIMILEMIGAFYFAKYFGVDVLEGMYVVGTLLVIIAYFLLSNGDAMSNLSDMAAAQEFHGMYMPDNREPKLFVNSFLIGTSIFFAVTVLVSILLRFF